MNNTIEYVDRCLACLNKLEQPVTAIAGIGPKTEASLNKLSYCSLYMISFGISNNRSSLQRNITTIADGELGTFVLTFYREKARHNAVGKSYRCCQGATIVKSTKAKFCNRSQVKMISGRVKTLERGCEIIHPETISSLDEGKDVLGIEPVY
ncbi:hypothetical protein HJC23_009276 [Cyclotella cryptica]|uniref:UmuC domain-containing protein n=1 Tax=Cyclotella cryptica TaxID=29204 RepID=A0ABD3Q560_9STRA